MAVTISCQGATTQFGIYTTYEADGGTLVANFGIPRLDPLSPLLELTHHEQLEQHIDELRGSYQLDHAIHASMGWGKVLRATYSSGCHREWRISDIVRARLRGGGKVARFEAEGPTEILKHRSGIVRQPHVTGRKDPYPQLFLTPAEHLAFGLRNSDAPAWVNVGTVDPTERLWISYERFNPWRLAIEVASKASERESVPYYAQLLRNGAADYDLLIVADPAPGADTVDVTYADNLLELSEQEVKEKFATQIYVSSGGEPAAEINLADNGFEIETITTTTVTNDTLTFFTKDSPFGEDDQLNGKYLEPADGSTPILVNDTIEPRQVVLAAGYPGAVGDRPRFVEDAAGSDLIFLGSPIGQAAHGKFTRTIKRDDIPPVVNLRPNPFLINGTTEPTGWNKLGAPTVTKDTTDFFSRFGLVSWRIQADEGEGLISDAQTVRFRPDREFITWGVAVWVVSGSFAIRIEDHSFPSSPEHPTEYFPDIANVPARTSVTGGWVELFVFPGINFLNLGSSSFKFKIFAEEDGSECYFDADQLVHRAHPSQIPNFWDGSAANDLWLIARDYLKAFGQAPLRYYDTRLVDKDRLGLVSGKEVVLGSFCNMSDAELGV